MWDMIGACVQDKKIDISTQVKQTQEKISSVAKKNDLRSKDVEAKQRQEDFFTLQRMKQWYRVTQCNALVSMWLSVSSNNAPFISIVI